MIASWPKPNYIDPVTRGNALPVLCIVFPSIGLVIVSVRTYSRLFITKAPGLDDLLMIAALAFAVALCVLISVEVDKYKINRHIWDIPLSLYSGNRLLVWCAQICYVASSGLVKVSVPTLLPSIVNLFLSRLQNCDMGRHSLQHTIHGWLLHRPNGRVSSS